MIGYDIGDEASGREFYGEFSLCGTNGAETSKSCRELVKNLPQSVNYR